MLRKIAEYVKKIFRMEPIPTTVNTLREALQSLEDVYKRQPPHDMATVLSASPGKGYQTFSAHHKATCRTVQVKYHSPCTIRCV